MENQNAAQPGPSAASSGSSFCECLAWARAGQPLTDEHHINCEHYRPAPPDPRHTAFGKLMWERIVKMGGDFFYDESSEEIMELALKAGLVERVPYDEEKHGYIEEAEPGHDIWWWGGSDSSNTH